VFVDIAGEPPFYSSWYNDGMLVLVIHLKDEIHRDGTMVGMASITDTIRIYEWI
jgi:hypothetical protein